MNFNKANKKLLKIHKMAIEEVNNMEASGLFSTQHFNNLVREILLKNNSLTEEEVRELKR